MLKLTILAFVLVNIVLVKSTSFEDTAFCLRGPTNWCQDLASANRCGAFKHCLQTIWSRHDRYLTVSQDATCDSCVKCLRGDYKSCPNLATNVDEVSQMVLANLPLQTICKLANGCDKPVEPVQIVQAPSLISESCGLLHPREWCDSIDNARRCNAVEQCRGIWKNLKPMILNQEYEKSEATCGFCIWIFNNLHEILQKNLTEFSIETYLKDACALIQNKYQEQQCNAIIEKNLPDIYNFVRDSLDPGIICRVIRFCNDKHLTEKQEKKKPSIFDYVHIEVINPENVIINTPYNVKKDDEHKIPLLGDKTEVLVSKLVKSSGVACEICSIVLTAAKYMIENEKNEERVVDFINKELCGRMGSLNSTCVEYINTFGKELLEELVHGVEPSIACQKMGLCLKSQVTSENTKRFFDINVKDSLNCTLCKTVMTEVKTMLANKQNENEILDYIRKNLCEKTGQYTEMCKTVINAYGPIILTLLSNDINPQQVCIIIGMCSKPKTTSFHLENTPKCAICEFVLSTLTNYISQNSSSSEVEKWLEYVCDNVMPVTIRGECKAFVEDYGPVVIALLVNEVKPDKICQFIGLCNKTIDTPKPITSPLETSIKASPECVICEFALTALTSFLSQNTSGPEVEKWLEYVCKTVMPETIRNECVAFVDQYEPVIIQLLVNEVQPDKVCQLIHVCDKHTVNTQTPITNEKPNTGSNPVYCTVCQYVIQFLKYELEKNNSKEAIEHALDTVCKLAPKSTKAQCESIVSTYGPYLIDMIEKYGEPLVVCQQLGLCGSSEQVKKPLDIVPSQTATTNSQERSIVENPPEATFECTLCLYVAEILDNALKQNKTDQEITEEIEKVCNFFPSPIKDQCKSFLDEYADYVLQLLAEDLDPNDVCQKLKLCKQFKYFSNKDFRSIIRTNRKKLTKN